MPSVFIDWRGAGPGAAAAFAKSRRRRWAVALLASGAVHAVASVALVAAYLQVPVEPPPIHVTLLQSAPPPPPPAPHPAGGESASTAPVEPPMPAVKKEVPKLARKTKHAKKKPTRVPTPGQSRQAAAPTVVATPGSGSAPAGGKVGGVLGGVLGGLVGGVVGGRGDRVYAPDEIATRPELVKKVMPIYPPIARNRGLEGLVVVEVVIDRQGHIEDDRVKVVQSVPGLDQAAIDALRQWRFRPGRDKEGRPVLVRVQIPFRFQLH